MPSSSTLPLQPGSPRKDIHETKIAPQTTNQVGRRSHRPSCERWQFSCHIPEYTRSECVSPQLQLSKSIQLTPYGAGLMGEADSCRRYVSSRPVVPCSMKLYNSAVVLSTRIGTNVKTRSQCCPKFYLSLDHCAVRYCESSTNLLGLRADTEGRHYQDTDGNIRNGCRDR